MKGKVPNLYPVSAEVDRRFIPGIPFSVRDFKIAGLTNGDKNRFKQEMWSHVAKEMGIPWRAAENMHWQLGEQEMARRAGVVPFSLSSVALDAPPKKRSPSRRSPSPGVSDESPASGAFAPQAETGPISGREDSAPK